MKILVTGAKGFIGRNLVAELRNLGYTDIFEYTRTTDPALLDEYCSNADFVYHCAGVNRSLDAEAFIKGNVDFTSTLLAALKRHDNTCPIVFSSSVHAGLSSDYGMSKKMTEDLLFRYSREMHSKILINRLPNVFGKWCRPNYNSVVATFFHNIAGDLPVQIHDRSTLVKLVYL